MMDRDNLAEYLTPIVFGVCLILSWEAIVRLFHIPLYIIPPPSAILVQYVRNIHRIWEYTLVTGMETIVGFGVSILLGVPLSHAGRLLASDAPDLLSLGGDAGDGAQDRLRADLRHLVRLRLPAQDPDRLPRLLLPDPAERHPRLHLPQPRPDPLLPLHRRRPLAHFHQGAAARGLAAALRRHQGSGGQRHGGCHDRRVDRRRCRPWLLRPDRLRRSAHGHCLRHHHHAGCARPAALLVASCWRNAGSSPGMCPSGRPMAW